MNSTWNKIIYKVWSPIYDQLFNRGLFLDARKKVFTGLELPKGSKVLFVGIGTGADLEFFNDRLLDLTAIDFSSDMLKIARGKYKNSNIDFVQMDAQDINFPDDSFDFIVASLILSVVPDPLKSLQEMNRVLKNGGSILIFDKFSSNKSGFYLTKILRPVIKVLGTDIGINHWELISKMDGALRIQKDDPVMLNGMYRKLLVEKVEGEGYARQ
ncbi:class I SAM-dependent methyltransferase [Bacillus sp. SG-1]|uniref:class I SAM-dependent methyltransferase n=1 Tax=Bacillus sp. SG-1 TaxID=161544 RepID=UPI0001543621|nr:class I SAM-dependent methyltransferase [Bacillus sp. SG-1]EDL66302.1 putative phosphatidylethanolamine N-methyltransferase [Bacillus sp. SG-1]